MTQRNTSDVIAVIAANITVHGDLDIERADEVRAALLAAQARCRSVVLDLEHVDFIDSSGLGIIVGAATRAERSQATFHLTNPSPPILRTLEMFGLNRLVAP